MPNSTFYNLPEAKRKRLMDAVWQEFTTVSYMDASINKIIQNADISRGSFYQYFSGKADVFSYVLHTILDTAKDMFLAQLTAHSNNLFDAILGMYDLILWQKSRNQRNLDLDRIRTLIKLNAELDISQFTEYIDCDAGAKNIKDLLAISGYTLETPLECHALIHMLASIALSNLTANLRHPNNEGRNRQLLEQLLELIRRGLPRLQKEGTTTC